MQPLEIVDQQHENESGAFLAAIVASSDDAIFGLTFDGIVVSWNKAAEEMYGDTAEEIVGKSVFPLCPPERAGEIEGNLARLSRKERVPHFQTVRMTKDHRRIDVQTLLEGGKILAPAHDLTQFAVCANLSCAVFITSTAKRTL